MNNFLSVKIAHRINGMNYQRSECIVPYPAAEWQRDDVFNFLWILEQSNLVAEFQVSSDGRILLPQDFGWALNKWVSKITYTNDKH
jgi:hypothetical protein